MKSLALLALSASFSGVLCAAIPPQEPLNNPHIHQGKEKFLIELEPDRSIWVTEEDKWILKLVFSLFLGLRCS